MSANLALAVAGGGFVGAPIRYVLDRYVTRRVNADLPWGTVLVNISGSCLLGLLTGLGLHGHVSPTIRALIGIGFCGAYTTFSTFSFETVRLIEAAKLRAAAANMAVSVVVGLVGAAGGLALGLRL